MDYVMNRDSISVCEPLFDSCQEQPIDIDYTLPDYCPDIQKILKCQAYPKIYTRNLSGDRLDVDGVTIVRIMYIEGIKKTIRCCEHSCPFSCSFNLKSVPQNAVVTTRTKPEYINCRALSPRRLDIHGAFTICAKVISKGEQEYVKSIDGDDVQMRKTPIKVSSATGLGQQTFSINEVIETGNAKSPVEAIIRADLTALITESKAISNKLMIKGDLNLKMLYLSDLNTGSIDTLDYTTPFSQIIDVDGIDEDSIADARIDILGYDVKLKSGFTDEAPVIEIDAKLLATATGYKEIETELIRDAYSMKYDMELTHKQIPFTGEVLMLGDVCISKSTIDLPNENMMKILDIWGENCNVSVMEEDDNKMMFNGKFNACILAMNNEEEPFYMERSIDFSHALPSVCKPNSTPTSADATILSMSYRLSGTNGLEIRTEIKLSATMTENLSMKSVTEAIADEENVKKKDNAALTLYFADKDESLWSIARKYSTGLDSIMEENELTEDNLDSRKMLLIPNV